MIVDSTDRDACTASGEDRAWPERAETAPHSMFGADGALDRMLQSFDDWLKCNDAAPRLA